MSRKEAIKVFEEKGEITIKACGKSMQPLIPDKSSIHLKKVDPSKLRVGDAVFCKVKNNLFVHMISAIKEDRFQISNKSGFVNGWIGANNIFGLCVGVNEKIIISDENLNKR